MHLLHRCSRPLFLAGLALALLASRARAISPGFSVLKTFDAAGSEPLAAPVQGPGGFLYAGAYDGGANNTGTLFKVRPDGTGYVILHTFGDGFSGDGNLPWGVIVGSDGSLYGSTDQGGTHHVGTLYKIQPDGTGYAVLHTFTGATTDGSRPFCTPVQGPGGRLYGTTYAGGIAGQGVVYSMATDGSGFTVLHSFTGGATDGATPLAALTVATDGNLYGVAQAGGSANAGVVFRLHPDGSAFALLHSFQSVAGDGVNPKQRMIQASDGALYGTTAGVGILFKLNLDGSGYTVLRSFSGNGSPEPGVVQASDGKLYGATIDGGTAFRGSIYKVNLDGTGFTVLRSFLGGNTDSWYPGTAPIQASDGALYGTSRFGGPILFPSGSGPGTVYKLNLDGSGAATPFILPTAASEAATPVDGLIQANDGALYGATSAGGTNGAGAVIKIQPDGTGFAVLHSFLGGASDGATANDSVVQASDGALYGVTYVGGAANAGIVYRLQRDGTGFAVLHSFANSTTDGGNPRGRLIQGTDGVLYGATANGGAGSSGTVFKINLDGSGYVVLHAFNAGVVGDGANPFSGLIQGSDGALYGTTVNGGGYGIGTVYRLQRDGTGYAIVHFFTGSLGDYDPKGGLLQGSDGALYGTTYGAINFYGGVSDYGCVYKVNPDGTGYNVLHAFVGGTYDAGFPSVALIRGANGSLYGSTSGGIAYYGGGGIGNGAIFRLNEDGSGYSVLYAFTGGASDGYIPSALVQASNGAFYGMTNGTASGLGLIFRATLGDVAPVAADQTLTLSPNTGTGITLSATDANGDALSYIIVTPPANGTLTGAAPNLSYNSGSFSGADSLTYVVSDGAVFSTVATVTLNVGVAGQTITFPAIPDHVYGNAPFTISASASSGLPITFSILSGPATVAGNVITLVGAGPVVVQAAQAGDSAYAAATATRGFSIAPAAASVALSNLSRTYDGSPQSATVTTTPAGLATTVTYNGSAIIPSAAGSYTVFAAISDPNYSGSAGGTLTITGGAPPPPPPTVQAPAITGQPLGQLLAFGGSVNLTVTANGTSPLAYQWYRDGAAIAAATSASYAATMVGTYTVVVGNSAGSVTSAQAIVISAARLANVSSRARVGSGDSVLILGLVVKGTPGTPKHLLVRAAGPALAAYGIAAPLAQPQLAIYSGAALVAGNQGWGTASDPAAIAAAATSTGAFPFAPGSADSALLVDLQPGVYSVVVSGANASTGIALAEAYELDALGGQLVNLSSRLQTGTGDDAAIVGFVITGQLPAKVLIRGIGPGLAAFGVSGALAKPQLAVYAGTTAIAANQGWSTAADPAALAAAAVTAGAFPLVDGSADCAAILTLPPGSYSAVVTGVGGTSGIALVEAYQLP